MSKQPKMRMGPGGEGAHWYAPSPDGALCAYQIEMTSKPGQWRDCNLRDARKFGLYPSVSKITRIENAEQLNRWGRLQAALSAATLPGIDEVGDEKEWFAAIEKDWKQQVKDAATGGTGIHQAVEEYFAGEVYKDEFAPHVDAAHKAINSIVSDPWHLDDFQTEESVTHPYGYGGRCDIYSRKLNMVLDFKSKEFDADTRLDVYANQGQALAAYREALGMPTARCFNIYLSRDNPGLYRVCEHPQDKLKNYWHQFAALLYFWQVQNNVPLLSDPYSIAL